jgi:glycerol-3-phosphate acyltransferase PlsY
MPINEALLHNWFYGNYYVRETAALAFAFLMGSIPIGPIFHWLFDEMDPRLASTASAVAPVVNTLKALLPVAIATHGGGTGIGLGAGVAVMFGHCFSPWRRFRGGTGVAAELGVLLGVCWPAGLFYFLLWVGVSAVTNYAVIGSLIASIVSVVSLFRFLGAPGAAAGLAMFLLLAARHQGSFWRLADDTEPALRKPAPAQTAAPASLVVVDGQAIQGF